MSDKKVSQALNELNRDMNVFKVEALMTNEEANEHAIKELIRHFPRLRNKLAALWKMGYKISIAERNALLVSMVRYTIFQEDYKRREVNRLRIKNEQLAQMDCFLDLVK